MTKLEESKVCRECGFEYKDGFNIVTFMEHIQEKHMNDNMGDK